MLKINFACAFEIAREHHTIDATGTKLQLLRQPHQPRQIQQLRQIRQLGQLGQLKHDDAQQTVQPTEDIIVHAWR